MGKRTVFFVSDGTGITAETLGYSLLTQFDSVEFEFIAKPYTDDYEKAETLVSDINAILSDTGEKAIVFSTLINPCIRKIISESNSFFMDVFSAYLKPLEEELHHKSTYAVGKTHSVSSYKDYKSRIEAIDFSMQTDDGVNMHQYDRADIILIGVSRSGKTPTSLYLSLQYGLYTANYPITEDDLEHKLELPKVLRPYIDKIFGLTIDADRLQAIRNERRPKSRYASASQCQSELKQVEKIFRQECIPFLNTTNLSIEEIATRIRSQLKIDKHRL